jgi:hypothetical protein
MSDTDASVVVRACGLRKEYGQNAGAVLGTVIAVAALTAIPARTGAWQPVAEILQAGTG